MYHFGAFEYDSRTGELRKRGIPIKLQDQPGQVLTLLLEHPGELITREDIQKRLWPDDTFVNFDNAINSAVRKLREALGDTAENPRFLETVARRGYRFTAPVSTAAEATPVPEPQLAPTARRMRSWRFAAVGTAVVGTGVLIAAFILIWNSSRVASEPRVTPLTANTGLELQPSISPDGTRVAYTWSEQEGKPFEIYLKLLGPGDPVQMTRGLGRVFSAAWSPDGRWIAAVHDLGDQAGIILIPATGGRFKEVARIRTGQQEDRVCAGTARPWVCGMPFWGSLLAWSHDGKYLFTSAMNAPAKPGWTIVRISVGTGELESFTSPPPGFADFGPAVSPDGTELAFVRLRNFKIGDLYTLSLTHGSVFPFGDPKRITTEHDDMLAPAWTANGRELIYSSNRSGRRELWRVRASGGASPERVAGVGENAADIAVSQSGRTLIYNRESFNGSLWEIPIFGRVAQTPVRITAITARDKYSHISPDGKRIAFQSGRSGVEEVWVCDRDGTNVLQLTSFGKGMSGTPRWSPDGRMIAFDSNVDGGWDIYVIPSAGGAPKRVTTNPAIDAIPSWSRDGAWIYFTSDRTGRGEIWKVRADGSADVQVTKDGAFTAMESADGKYLYVKRGTEESGDIFRVRTNGTEPVKVLSGVNGRVFRVLARGIYFSAGDPRPQLRYLDFASGAIRVVAPIRGFPDADVSPDESWAVYPQYRRSDTNLTVVQD